jgi:predicted nuclease of predicted toxin-antitoxin system
MKIILDMNIPTIWERFLNQAGHEAIHWRTIGDIRADDTEIMAWAKVNNYIVFTHDLDFGSILYATNAKAPSVIQLRVEHILPEIVGDAVLETLSSASAKLKDGALITIDLRRHRIRLLPLRND